MAGRRKPIEIEVEVEFVPFPSEERRLEAYRTHARLFLKAKERELRMQAKDRAGKS